jgi:hypothetical protein
MCGQTVKWFWDGYILKVHQMLNMQNWKLDIKEALPNANWHHVSASQNIVDLLTRRKSPKKLKSSHLWWHGPKNIMESQEWENLPTQAPSVTHNNAVDSTTGAFPTVSGKQMQRFQEVCQDLWVGKTVH